MSTISRSPAEESLLTSMPGPEAEFARRVRSGGLGSFLNFALQNRSRSARGVLARAASDGVLGLTELDGLMQSLGEDESSTRHLVLELVASLQPKVLLALAGLMANQRFTAEDIRQAIALYTLILQAHGKGVFGRVDRMLFLELLSDDGRHEEFEANFTSLALAHEDWRQAMLMMANLVNPWNADTDRGNLASWLRFTSSIFNDAGVEPFDVDTTVGHPFDNILCASAADLTGGPQVSVLVPTYNAGPRLGTALASLLNQTWRNLQIVVLDDGSDAQHRYYMDAWAERDTRIEAIHLPKNGGNYAARNVGLQRATGDFVTVHDDDDWSHPRKLESQARALMENPEQLANMSRLIRTTNSFHFTRINGNPDFVQPNYSSLMFRREPVLSGIGYWNEVNRAADAEFRDRLAAWSGSVPAVVGAAPLSLLRVRSGSLTSGEIHRGYLDPRRRWYQMSTEGWRADVAAQGDSLFIPPADPQRKFSVPASMLAAPQPIRTDTVYATDFRFPGGNTSVSINEIRTLLDNGYRVAVMQLDSPVLGSTKHLSMNIRELSKHPRCQVVTLLDRVDCDVLIVRHPTVMQFAERRRSGVRAKRAVLIVNHAPAMRDGSASHYDPQTCVDTFTSVFGQPPLVAPESGVIRECLRGSVERAPLSGFDWTGIVSVEQRPPRRAMPDRPPVIGRHSRDNAEKWPTDLGDLEAAYPVDGSRDVRILGGADVPLGRLADRDVRGWTVHPFGSMPAQDFLVQLDFWVYFHAEHLIESFGMATAEAMASGAVVILPPYMRPTFGPGAIYCKPAEVQDIVTHMWASKAAYERQSALAIEVASAEFTVDTFLARMAALRHE
jgi:hypothetical protein